MKKLTTSVTDRFCIRVQKSLENVVRDTVGHDNVASVSATELYGSLVAVCASPQACRSVGVECIVAPYEADAQLAYLSREGIVDLVITEDSDLLVFGCKQVSVHAACASDHGCSSEAFSIVTGAV